jgi:serine/threonine protein kinase/Tfp pilus assembly protein PilF
VNANIDPRWRRLGELFDQAAPLAEQQRVEFVAALKGEDIVLRAELQALLNADSGSGVLDRCVQDMAAGIDDADMASSLIGQTCGHWRIVEILGRGGMGAVYRAARADGAYEQQAALKLIRVGLDTPDVRARFLRERQTLARLKHPHIATLLDGGVGPNGIPYFAMELVDGEPIDRWCDLRRLDPRARLLLFLQVLDAIQHAHQQLIVHRDLKPSNILVNANGAVKLLDFGIAKLLEEDDGATRDHAFTPEYAAPEQLRGEPITTATDIYALGVLLYRLLSGAHPFGVTSHTPIQRQMQLLDQESTDLTGAAARADREVAAARGLSQRALLRALRGDLAAITAACLAKEPSQRYASAESLATDIKRHLEGRPVSVRAKSRRYRALKFARRNRIVIAASSIVVLALLVGMGAALWQARRAEIAAAHALNEARVADAVKQYLLDVFGSADPYNTDGKIVTAKELLEQGAARVDQLQAQPEVQADLYRAFGDLFSRLDRKPLARDNYTRALGLYKRTRTEDDPQVLSVDADLAAQRYYMGDYVGLVEDLQRLSAMTLNRQPEVFDTHVEVGHLRVLTFLALGDFDAAATAGNEIRTAIVSARGERNYEASFALYDLALVRLAQGRLSDAAALVNSLVPVDRSLVGPDHPGLVTDVQVIARLAIASGRAEAAGELLDYVVARRVAKFGEQHVLTWNARGLRAEAAALRGDWTAADRDFVAGISGIEGRYGPAHRDLGTLRRNYGAMLLSAGRLDAASEQLRKAQTIWEGHGGSSHPSALASRELLAEVALAQGQSSLARQQLVAVIDLQRRRPNAYLARSLWTLATLDTSANDVASAARNINQARALLHDLGADDSELAQRIRHTTGQDDSVSDATGHTLDHLLEQARAIIAAAPQR